MILNVRIVSLFAMCDPARKTFTWEGEVVLSPDYDDAPDTEICERLYRIFNRVEEADADFLERIAYRLPSLSASDLVAFSSNGDRVRIFRVASVGFTEILPGLGG